MKIKLDDGREIDTLAVDVYGRAMSVLALIDCLDVESTVWLRSRLSDAQKTPSEHQSEHEQLANRALSALIDMCNAQLNKE